jgi:hypothetical protein
MTMRNMHVPYQRRVMPLPAARVCIAFQLLAAWLCRSYRARGASVGAGGCAACTWLLTPVTLWLHAVLAVFVKHLSFTVG